MAWSHTHTGNLYHACVAHDLQLHSQFVLSVERAEIVLLEHYESEADASSSKGTPWPASRKGKQLTPAQLLARKPRVELTLKRKCEIIDEAKKRGFKPDIMERTLNRINQTN